MELASFVGGFGIQRFSLAGRKTYQVGNVKRQMVGMGGRSQMEDESTQCDGLGGSRDGNIKIKSGVFIVIVD